MTSQGRSENSDQSAPLHPMLPNADPLGPTGVSVMSRSLLGGREHQITYANVDIELNSV